jgi:hypothetical protein
MLFAIPLQPSDGNQLHQSGATCDELDVTDNPAAGNIS